MYRTFTIFSKRRQKITTWERNEDGETWKACALYAFFCLKSRLYFCFSSLLRDVKMEKFTCLLFLFPIALYFLYYNLLLETKKKIYLSFIYKKWHDDEAYCVFILSILSRECFFLAKINACFFCWGKSIKKNNKQNHIIFFFKFTF